MGSKLTRTGIFAALSMVLCTFVLAHSWENLVTNPLFEESDASGAPSGWRITGGEGLLDENAAYRGRYALHLKRANRAAFARQDIGVKPNTGYIARAMILAPRPSSFLIVIYNPDGTTLTAFRTGWARIDDWTLMELPFRTGDQKSIQLALMSWGPDAWFDAVELIEDDSVRTGDVTPTGTPAVVDESALTRGFVTFTRPLHDLTLARHAPSNEEMQSSVKAITPRGEAKTMMAMIYALRDLDGVEARLYKPFMTEDGEALSPESVEIFRLGYSRRAISDDSYVRYPLLLLPERPAGVPGGDCAQFAVRVTVPPDARAGEYTGLLGIYAGGMLRAEVPLHLEVLPFQLDPADIAFGMYYADVYFPEEMATRELQELYYRHMAAMGMNFLPLYVDPEREENGGFSVCLESNHRRDFGPEDPRRSLGMGERLAGMESAGLLSPDRPLMLLTRGGGLSHWGDLHGGPDTVRSLLKLGEKHGWPPLLFYVHDEPGDEERQNAVRAIFRKIYSEVPEARTTTAFGHYGLEEVGHLYDVWIVGTGIMTPELIERAEREGKELWVYNCNWRGERAVIDRHMTGLYTWNTGARGKLQWAYYARKKIERDDSGLFMVPETWGGGGAEGWYMAPSEDGPIGTVGLEARREGIMDYRYLLTLSRLLDSADIGLRARAEALFDEVKRLAPIDGFVKPMASFLRTWDYNPAPELMPEDYTRIRREAAELIRLMMGK